MNAIVFDAVGTLLLPARPVAEVYAETAHRYGIPLDHLIIATRFRDAFAHQESLDAATGWQVSEARELERWRSIVQSVIPGSSEECFHELYDHYAKPESWSLSAGVPETLTELSRRGIRIGLASNLDHRLTKIVAGHPELRCLEDRIAISSVLGYRKPHPMFYTAVSRIMQCPPGTITFVGDDLANDYDGANRAGMTAVLYDPQNRFPQTPSRIESMTDLLRLVK